jgi:pimeloyl-ACP methyl ester carboxylesterase
MVVSPSAVLRNQAFPLSNAGSASRSRKALAVRKGSRSAAPAVGSSLRIRWDERKREEHPLARATQTGEAGPVSSPDEGEEEVCVLWLKNDLRVDDHPGLVRAAQEATSKKATRLLPLYIFDPELFSPYQESHADIEWLHEALCSLQDKFADLGCDLAFRMGKAEEVLPSICSEARVTTIVTQKETNCLWVDKLQKIEAELQKGKSHCDLQTYTYNLFEGAEVYPTTFTEMENWSTQAKPVEIPTNLDLNALSSGAATAIPSSEELYQSMTECWANTWGDLEMNMNPSEDVDKGVGFDGHNQSSSTFPYKSAYCGADLLAELGDMKGFSLSGHHDQVESQLRSYFKAFQMWEGETNQMNEKGRRNSDDVDTARLCDVALSLEVPGAFGQSFNVLFRKHLSHGLLSPGQVFRAAEKYRTEHFDDPLAFCSLVLSGKAGTAFKGANAAKEAALKYDVTKNIHQHSLEKDSLLATKATSTTTASSLDSSLIVQKSWQWRGAHQEFIEASPSHREENQSEEKIVVLVHGFGAFGAHWRDNAKGLLAKGYKVYCPTLPGYGRSEKASAQYTPQFWSEYVRDFITNVVKRPVVIAGNSIGGYISAYTSAKNPELIKGLVLVNTAGRLQQKEEDTEEQKKKNANAASMYEESEIEAIVAKVTKQVVSEVGSRLIFLYLERSVSGLLKKAYTQYPERADEDLVREIERASADPGAFDVFKSVFYLPKPVPLNNLLHEYSGPTLVFQGVNDPLNDARARAQQMKEMYAPLKLKLVEAGHCPHDEVPELFNEAFDSFFAELATPPTSSASASTEAEAAELTPQP